jgi:CRP/FNR family cyclic AMP-dependent transcriptional regulator
LVDQLFNSSEKRLAEMIGTRLRPRSRVSHFMNKFRQLGLVEYNGILKVHTSLLDVVLRESAPHIKAPK